MRRGERIAVVIPARDEEDAIAKVIGDIPDWVDETIVADNGSRDETAARASAAGARVVPEPEPGYGGACLAGIAAIERTDIVVFLDGDYSDYPGEMVALFDPILEEYELTVRRVLQLRGTDVLLQNQRTVQRAIRLRNPYVDPISLLQTELLKRWRSNGRPDDATLTALFASINGIAHALQNTG